MNVACGFYILYTFWLLFPNLQIRLGCCDVVEAKSRSGRRHAVSVTKMTGKTKEDPRRADAVARSRLDLLARYK